MMRLLTFRVALSELIRRLRWLAESTRHTVGVVVYARRQGHAWGICAEAAFTSYGPFLARRQRLYCRWLAWREYRRMRRAWPDYEVSLRDLSADIERAYAASQRPPSVDISALVPAPRFNLRS